MSVLPVAARRAARPGWAHLALSPSGVLLDGRPLPPDVVVDLALVDGLAVPVRVDVRGGQALATLRLGGPWERASRDTHLLAPEVEIVLPRDAELRWRRR